ncbi:class I SAM-dependent methyltransferase [Paenibacillus mendelii]|uniref:Class I SAM-dependent methyltransferase n=1 Tax=Paenibacillus mendelii TaxID=206163 RepID=A0ABV6JKL3_9BACL|nr:class I SAM-dependent methyltransferase [Paenibacillus mendelii]MCQ6563026.1 class I SAM-dependent methyltransferase [Paenibacillus mendelii]
MNEIDYKAFYDQIGRLNGWDFSKVKAASEGVLWDFFPEVTRHCKPSDICLDIGTGGGEALLSIADCALLFVGIDQSAGMIETARKRAEESGKPNVRFLQMDARRLEFPERFFQVVSCRHSPFDAAEVAKVLAQDGVFLTQQVGEKDKLNVKEAFGRGQAWEAEEGALTSQYVTELREAGFTDIRTFHYNAAEYYETAEDLLFLLKHTPIIPEFGQREADFPILHQFIQDYTEDKGIRTNSERYMIIAKK